jgi:hypothetical protein
LAGQLDEVTFNTNIDSLDYKNLYSYSQKIDPIGNPDNRFWGNTNLTLFSSNSAIAPDGTLTAWTANNTPNLNSSFLNPNISNSSRLIKPNTYYTKSIYAKFVSGSPTLIFQLIRNSDSVYFTPQFNLQTGVATVSTNTSSNWGMNYINNGWWRCWGSFYSGANTAGGFSGDSFFIGGYGSTPLNTSHQYWGAQFEQGNTVSIYTATGAPANTSFATYSGPGVPITGFAARTDNAGNIYVTGNYDEVTYNPNSGYIQNLAAYSQNGSQWGISGSSTIISTTELAPDGTYTAVRIRPTSQYGGIRTQNACWLPNIPMIGSAWVRVDIGTRSLSFNLNGGGMSSVFTATSTWQRFNSISYSKPVSYTDNLTINDQNTTGFVDFIVWGIQVEKGSSITPYVATGAGGIPLGQ